MTTLKNTLILVAGSIFALTSASALSITSFGTGQWSDSGFTDVSVDSQDGISLTFSGTDTNLLSGDVPLVDLSSVWGNNLVITGSVATDPGTTFGVTLFDQEFDTATFNNGSWSDLGSGSTTLTFVGASGAFNTSQIIGIDIQGGGGGDALAATLTGASISAVPEPSAFALLAGCFGMAWVMVRRRA